MLWRRGSSSRVGGGRRRLEPRVGNLGRSMNGKSDIEGRAGEEIAEAFDGTGKFQSFVDLGRRMSASIRGRERLLKPNDAVLILVVVWPFLPVVERYNKDILGVRRERREERGYEGAVSYRPIWTDLDLSDEFNSLAGRSEARRRAPLEFRKSGSPWG